MAEQYIIGNNAQFNDSVEILKDLTLYGVVENSTDFAVKIKGDEKLRITSEGALIGDTISHIGDTDTKIRFPENDVISFETAGSEGLRITSNGRVGINTDNPSRLLEINTTGTSTEGIVVKSNDNTYPRLQFSSARTNADAFLGMISAQWDGTLVADIIFESGSDTTNKDDGLISFRTAASGGTREERLRISSNGMLLKGHTESAGQIETQLNQQNQFHGNDRRGGIRIADFSDSQFPANLEFVKSRNATIGQNTILQDGDRMGSIYWGGANGTNYQPAAFITAITDGTVSSTSMPGAITFGTNEGDNLVERLRIKPNGDLQFNSGFGSVQTAYGVRAWALWNGETNTLLDDGNIAGFTDEGTGTYTFTFDNNMPDSNYVITGSTGRNAKPHFSLSGNVRSASSFKISTGTWGSSYTAVDVDSAMFCVIC